MYVIESKTAAIGCMILSLCCLGSWPAILTLLERRGRLPQHTFLDFTTANLLAAIVIAFTLGEDNWPSVLLAVVGVVLLSVGNLATQYALAFVGLPVTEVITASITVVIVTRLLLSLGSPRHQQRRGMGVDMLLIDEKVMESLEHAMKRDAPLVVNILEALLTVILLILLIQELGLGVSSCIESYLEEAGVSPEDVTSLNQMLYVPYRRNGPAYDDNEIVSSLMFSPPAFPLFLLRFPATLRQQLQVSVRLSLDDETVVYTSNY
uniref:Uncharacterized protein n=1 Tax=Brassica oleracea var. oleracea TaxID=109376 RepID=A0A0D3E7R0_BRAOL